MLVCFWILSTAAGSRLGADESIVIVAGMSGVAAMAVQNALVQISLKGAPSTAVMTTNILCFATDIGAALLGDDPADIAAARNRTTRTLLVILGFAAEIALGAVSLALPAFSALITPFIASESRPISSQVDHPPPNK